MNKREREKCNCDCGFLAYVSKVGRSETYKLKTLKAEHNRGRFFNNKNKRSKWVAKKLRSCATR